MVVSPSALDRFCGPKGVCSSEVAAEARVIFLSSALASTVASTGCKLAVSSTHKQFGHLVPAVVAKHQPDSQKTFYPYFGYPDENQGTIRRKELATKWNPSPPSASAHLNHLEAIRSNTMVGFLLVVAHHWHKESATFGAPPPILRVAVAPSLMTCDTQYFSHDATGQVQGAPSAEDVWSTPPSFIDPTDHVSLLLAAGGGRIRKKTTSMSLPGILLSTETIVFPSAFDLTGSTMINLASLAPSIGLQRPYWSDLAPRRPHV